MMLEGLGVSLADYRRRLRAAQARALADTVRPLPEPRDD
jgi:hypothetical protein